MSGVKIGNTRQQRGTWLSLILIFILISPLISFPGSMPPAPPADSSNAALSRLSLLAPPTLTVIHPTPEASPVTPSPRRVSPLDVSQAQKSRSSGSGKRKAEGLPDLEGHTATPSKDQREHRATFAPDPRSAYFNPNFHQLM